MGRKPWFGVAGLLLAGVALTGCCQNGACRRDSTTSGDVARQTAAERNSTTKANPYQNSNTPLIGSPAEASGRMAGNAGQVPGPAQTANSNPANASTAMARDTYPSLPQANSAPTIPANQYGAPPSFGRSVNDTTSAGPRVMEERLPPTINPPGLPAGMSLPPSVPYNVPAASGVRPTSFNQAVPLDPPPPTPASQSMSDASQSRYQGYPAARGVPTTPAMPAGMGGIGE